MHVFMVNLPQIHNGIMCNLKSWTECIAEHFQKQHQHPIVLFFLIFLLFLRGYTFFGQDSEKSHQFWPLCTQQRVLLFLRITLVWGKTACMESKETIHWLKMHQKVLVLSPHNGCNVELYSYLNYSVFGESIGQLQNPFYVTSF